MASDEQKVRFAWCFSHGRIHHDPTWCTATWSPLDGTTKEQALADRHRRYGTAEFLHQLPIDVQMAVIKTDRTASLGGARA